MYYSEKTRKAKIKELENNKEFMDYAEKRWQEIRDSQSRCRTFEDYLIDQVFVLYDNFTMLQFLETSDKKTIDRVMNDALKGLWI
mgnify:CR=1 FL=1